MVAACIRSPGGDSAPVMTTPTARTDGGPAANGSGKITRDAVLAAALEIIDRDGADALSMRRLARALGRDPMILYRHAPNKAALLDGVAETVLAQLHVDSADPDWAGQLREVARRYRALALAHPHVVPLIVTRPLATPLGLRPAGTLRPLEDILALLTRAGFSGPAVEGCTGLAVCRRGAGRGRCRGASGRHRLLLRPQGPARAAVPAGTAGAALFVGTRRVRVYRCRVSPAVTACGRSGCGAAVASAFGCESGSRVWRTSHGWAGLAVSGRGAAAGGSPSAARTGVPARAAGG